MARKAKRRLAYFEAVEATQKTAARVGPVAMKYEVRTSEFSKHCRAKQSRDYASHSPAPIRPGWQTHS